MGDDKNKYCNQQMVAYCPVCGREMVWLPFPPKHPDADYVAFCLWCNNDFGVSVPKDSK